MRDDNDRRICKRQDLRDGGRAARFQIEFDGRHIQTFAIAYGGNYYAYANSCPHRGTELDWQPGEVFDESGLYLVCATHGALFEADSGRCVGGPCLGATLRKIPINVCNDDINLSAGRLIAVQLPEQT